MSRPMFGGAYKVDAIVVAQLQDLQLARMLRHHGVPIADDGTAMPGYTLRKEANPADLSQTWIWKKVVADDVQPAVEPFARLWGQEPLVLASEAYNNPPSSAAHVVASVLLKWDERFGDEERAWDTICRLIRGRIRCSQTK